MTRNVNGFCPETSTFAPNLEQHNHWSVEKPPSFAVDGESFLGIPGAMGVSKNVGIYSKSEPPYPDVLPYLTHIRLRNARKRVLHAVSSAMVYLLYLVQEACSAHVTASVRYIGQIRAPIHHPYYLLSLVGTPVGFQLLSGRCHFLGFVLPLLM
jgi:hypothetical protein